MGHCLGEPCKTPFLFMTTAEKIAAAKKRVAELERLIKLWSKSKL